jgi:hypothetical protein
MIKKPLEIQGNIDRSGSANMYLTVALNSLGIARSEVLSPLEEMDLKLFASSKAESKLFKYKFEKFRQLCKENFWHVAQDNQDPSLDPFLVITHDHLRERSQTELRQGLTAFEAYERQIEMVKVAHSFPTMALDVSPKSMPTQGIIEWEIYRVVVKSRPLPKIFYKPDWRWGHDTEYIPVWDLTGDR